MALSAALLNIVLAADPAPVEDTRNPILPQANELIYGTLAFLVFLAFAVKYALPKAEQALADRRASIEGKMEAAEADRVAAATMLADYKSQLSDARGEAGRIIEDARAQAESIKAEQLAVTQEESARILAAARAQAEADRAQTAAELKTELGTLALDLAGRIVGQQLGNDDTQRRLVDEFISGVGV